MHICVKEQQRRVEKIKENRDLSKITIDDVKIIGTSILKELFTWVDTSYMVHDNMSIQTGSVMLMVYRIVNYRSTKKKLNIKSLTES